MRIFLFPFSFLFFLILLFRAIFYRLNILKSYTAKIPVISIGNITVGGSGKTPLVLEVLKWAASQNKKVAVVYRGYKREGREKLLQVQIDSAAKYVGDEAALVKMRFPNVAVFVSARRRLAIEEIEKMGGVDFILLDDAFQHWAVQRKADVVILDVSDPLWSYSLLPVGDMREPWSALARADFVLYHKCNFGKKNLTYLEKRVSRFCKQVGYSQVGVRGFSRLQNQSLREVKEVPMGEVVLVSAIAKPEQFEKSFQEINKAKIVQHFRFTDHFSYSEVEQKRILTFCQEKHVTNLVFTEKDAVKWKDLPEISDLNIWVLVVGVDFEQGEADFYEILRRKTT